MSDQEEIRRTLALYCQTCDDGRFAEFAELFGEDAQFTVGSSDPVVGREAIRTFMETAQPPERRGKHLCGEPAIDFHDATATATTDFVFVSRSLSAGWSITATGRYLDELVRHDDGRWRFRSRTIHLQ